MSVVSLLYTYVLKPFDLRNAETPEFEIFETIYFETLTPSRGVRSPIGPVSKIRYISHWPLMHHRMDRLQSGTLCTDDDILIDLIFIYFPETLGFWERQVHWKPLSTRGSPLSLETLKPLDLWYPWNIGPMKPCKSGKYWPLNPCSYYFIEIWSPEALGIIGDLLSAPLK